MPKPRPRKKPARKKSAGRSGQVPDGKVGLHANIRDDLHLRLKIEAAKRRITIGDLLEELIQKNLKSRR